MVLNLIITGIPSILPASAPAPLTSGDGFKPYYNWNTFNTATMVGFAIGFAVLNLIITGIPSIQNIQTPGSVEYFSSFKPYYNWNTFNTLDLNKNIDFMVDWFTF